MLFRSVLRVKLKHLDSWSAGRQRNAAVYRELFAQAGLGQVGLPVEAPHRRHIYNQFVIRVSRRDELIAHLKKHNIGTEIYYPVPLHLQECFVSLGHQRGEFPASEQAANETLALPIYPELSDDDKARIVAVIATSGLV